MKLSIIIPAYRQESTIVKDISNIVALLEETYYNFEVIVVVDGFVDQTYQKVQELQSEKVVVLGYSQNRGKGFAVRYGMNRSSGNIIGFIDAGMDLHPEGIIMLIEHMKWYNADIIVGSKRHPVSQVHYPPVRRIYSKVFQLLIKALFGLKVRDTQVGLKLFRREVLQDIMPRLLVKRYAFDVEMLAVANYLGYKRIFEAPVQLAYNFQSSINVNAIIHMLRDTLAVYYRLKIKHYYNNENAAEWSTELQSTAFIENLPIPEEYSFETSNEEIK